MKSLSLFETKNRFSAVCGEVASTGEPLTVTRRGRPLVQIVPVRQTEEVGSVWDTLEESQQRWGNLPDDWELPVRRPGENRPDPLEA